MWQFFYIFTAVIAVFDLAELSKNKQKKEAAVYTVLLLIMLIYSIFYYSTNLSSADYYTIFKNIF